MRCPRCGTRKVRPNGDRLWFCSVCDMMFDNSGDDGDIGYRRPETNAARREEYQQRQRRGGNTDRGMKGGKRR